jgi:hypothetical protein
VDDEKNKNKNEDEPGDNDAAGEVLDEAGGGLRGML